MLPAKYKRFSNLTNPSRSSLPGNMLSYLEHYSADYFLLENVEGLLTYPLMSTQGSDGRKLEGGIQAGVVKFIMRTLIALGYASPLDPLRS